MSKIINTFHVLRNHWKKTIFFSCVASYGVSFAREKFETFKLMQAYCHEAIRYGEEFTTPTTELRSVTVILNPNANGRKAQKLFKKHCEPLFHLAGLKVDVMVTKSEGHARTLTSEILGQGTDAIIVAGGDGTLSEVLTGMYRRSENPNMIPIGALPLGKTNTLVKSLFPHKQEANLTEIRQMIESSMAIIKQTLRPVDVMRIQVLDDQLKPVYACNQIDLGAFRDAEIATDSYWYFGPLRNIAAFFFKANLEPIPVAIKHSPPCLGCKNCLNARVQGGSFFGRLFHRNSVQMDRSQIENLKCSEVSYDRIDTLNLEITTDNVEREIEETNGNVDGNVPKLTIKTSPDNLTLLEFIKHGWNGTRAISGTIHARQVVLEPFKSPDYLLDDVVNDNKLDSDEIQVKEKLGKLREMSVDNETFEIKPICVTLLPKLLNIYGK